MQPLRWVTHTKLLRQELRRLELDVGRSHPFSAREAPHEVLLEYRVSIEVGFERALVALLTGLSFHEVFEFVGLFRAKLLGGFRRGGDLRHVGLVHFG